MSSIHDAHSWIVGGVAGGAIAVGHAVIISSGEWIQCTGADSAMGVYVGEVAAADHDQISVCVGGPCKVFADGTSAITIGSLLCNDTSGHAIVNATDKDLIMGRALEALASGTALIEMVFAPASFNAV